MRAFQCDRCGDFEKGEPGLVIQTNEEERWSEHRTGTEAQLCMKCTSDFRMWICTIVRAAKKLP